MVYSDGMTTKMLSEVEVGEQVLAMGAKTFTEPLTVTEIKRLNGSPIFFRLHGGRGWPMAPGTAEETEVTVA